MSKYQVGDKITVELEIKNVGPNYYTLGPPGEGKGPTYEFKSTIDKWDVLKYTPVPREWKVGDVYYNKLDPVHSRYERQVLFIDDKWVIRMEETPYGPKSYVFSRLQWDSDTNKVFMHNVND